MNSTVTTTIFDPSSAEVKKYLKQIHNPILQRFFLITKLPSAFFMGLRICSVSPQKGVVSVPYSWRSKNPFKSTYFAAQAAAAEMSTGVLGILALTGRHDVSMLITKIEGSYGKKATSLATFTCTDGDKIIQAVQQAVQTGEAQEVIMQSIGTQKNKAGEIEEISRFYFTWSFKKKNKS